MISSISTTTLSRRSFLAICGLSAATIAAFPSHAFATAWSSSKTRQQNGVSYTYRSGLDAGLKPKAYAQITASRAVSAGKMRARALIINSLGNQIMATGSWASNSGSATSLTATVTMSYKGPGYKGRGEVKIDGYFDNCNPTAAAQSAPPSLPVNATGQTYGTYFDVEQGRIPDLIAIVADNGAEGYVRYEQFASENASESIPVYDVEGATIVGMFTFGDK